MKRIILFAAMILMMTLLASCGDSGDPRFAADEYLEACDQNRNLPPIFDGLCKSGDTFYICTHSGKVLLQLFDGKSGMSMPLCIKPECTHTDDSCNAVLSGYANGLSVYEGRLYWAGVSNDFNYAVYSESLDGTGRQILRELPEEWVNLDDYTVFHRGKVYGAGILESISGGSPEYTVKVCGGTLDGNDSFTVLDKTFIGGASPKVEIQAVGNTLYAAIMTENTLELYSWDCQKQDMNSIYSGSVDFKPGEFWADSAGDIYISGGLNVYKLSKGKELSKVFDFSEMGDLARIAGFCDGYVIADELCADGTIGVLIKDYSGNTVVESNFGEIGKNMGRAYFGCCDDSLIYRFYDMDNGAMTYMSIPFSGDQATLLWKFDM